MTPRELGGARWEYGERGLLENGAVNWTHSFSPNMLNEAAVWEELVKLPTGLTTFDSSVGARATHRH